MKYIVKKKANPHSYVHTLGFLYPLVYNSEPVDSLEFRKLREQLENEFGPPCQNWHFRKGCGTSSCEPGIRYNLGAEPRELRWYAGPVKWNDRSSWGSGPKHFVFRTEEDRTWARILLGKN